VKSLSAGFLLILCSGCASEVDPLPVPLQKLAESTENDELVEFLSRQGKSPYDYLNWRTTFSSCHLLHTVGLYQARSQRQPCFVLILGQDSWDIPGDWIQRHILIDAESRIRDVATLVCTTRLMERFIVDARSDEGGADIVDLEPDQEWGNFSPMRVELGVGSDRRGYVDLPWQGRPILGTLAIDAMRFQVRR